MSYVEEVQTFFTWSLFFFAPDGVPIVAPQDLLQHAIIFHLTIVVIKVGLVVLAVQRSLVCGG